MKKTAGIVVDNYNIETYKTELSKEGFTEVTIHPFTKNTTIIKVICEEQRYGDIHKLCMRIETRFGNLKYK